MRLLLILVTGLLLGCSAEDPEPIESFESGPWSFHLLGEDHTSLVGEGADGQIYFRLQEDNGQLVLQDEGLLPEGHEGVMSYFYLKTDDGEVVGWLTPRE